MLAPAAAAALEALPAVADLLRFMLVRDARRRPTIADVLHRRALSALSPILYRQSSES